MADPKSDKPSIEGSVVLLAVDDDAYLSTGERWEVEVETSTFDLTRPSEDATHRERGTPSP